MKKIVPILWPNVLRWELKAITPLENLKTTPARQSPSNMSNNYSHQSD